MSKLYKLFLLSTFVSSCGFAWPSSWLINHETAQSTPTISSSQAWVNNEAQILHTSASALDVKILRLSLTAYLNTVKKGYKPKKMLTVIDYAKPSTEKRLWVFDLTRGKTLYNTWVAHGKNSGDVRTTSFSNGNGSLKSSIGVFLTDAPYDGKNGLSLHLRGLEHGFNDNAYSRAVVVHGASYVNADIIRKLGRIGRSWGCPAVSPGLAKPIINTIKYNNVVVAYYPDKHWLSKSKFLVS